MKKLMIAAVCTFLPAMVAQAGTMTFEQLDTDKNGVVSQEEAAAHPAIAKVFTTLDANNDGELSVEELATMTLIK